MPGSGAQQGLESGVSALVEFRRSCLPREPQIAGAKIIVADF